MKGGRGRGGVFYAPDMPRESVGPFGGGGTEFDPPLPSLIYSSKSSNFKYSVPGAIVLFIGYVLSVISTCVIILTFPIVLELGKWLGNYTCSFHLRE